MKEYQQRPDHVAFTAWGRGYMTPLELFRVAAWKTGQGLGSLTLNSEDEIKDRTQAAIEAIRHWRGRPVSGRTTDIMWKDWHETARRAVGAADANSGLLGLRGVGYPMATAILDILDPGVWPVMDRWAIMTVFGPGPEGGPRTTRQWQHAAAYRAYARHLVDHGAVAWGDGLSVHQLDQKAMNLAMNNDPMPAGWRYAELPIRR